MFQSRPLCARRSRDRTIPRGRAPAAKRCGRGGEGCTGGWCRTKHRAIRIEVHDRRIDSAFVQRVSLANAAGPVIAIDGSGHLSEINSAVVEREGYSEEQQSILHGDGPQTEIEYRLAWARTYLKGMGLLENSERGVWSVTEQGRQAKEGDLKALRAEYLRRLKEERDQRRGNGGDANDDEGAGSTWKDDLLITYSGSRPTVSSGWPGEFLARGRLHQHPGHWQGRGWRD